MTKEYKVLITETLQKTVIVEAGSEAEAHTSGAGTASPKHTLGIQLAASEHPEPQGARGSRTVVM